MRDRSRNSFWMGVALTLAALVAVGASMVPFTAIKLIDDSGATYGVKQIDGKPRTSSMPYQFDIAEGNVADHSPINKFGHNGDVGATPETIWPTGGLYTDISSAVGLDILSSDADDTTAGAGARTVQIYGLDGNYAEQNETITLNGSTATSSTNTYLFINRAIVRSAGSSGWNEGTITIREGPSNAVRMTVPQFQNQTLHGRWTVPAGYTAYITRWYFSSNVANKQTEAGLYVRPFGEVFQLKRFIHLIGQPYNVPIDFPEVVTEKSTIEVRASTGGGGGDVSGGFFLWYEAN